MKTTIRAFNLCLIIWFEFTACGGGIASQGEEQLESVKGSDPEEQSPRDIPSVSVEIDKDATARHSGPSMLWKVRSATATAFLLGSIHLASPDVYPWADAIESAFNQADTVVFEIHLDEQTIKETARLMQQYAQYPERETIADHLDATTFEKLNKMLEARELPPNVFDRFRPWAVAVMLSITAIQQLGYLADFGIDNLIYKRSENTGKKIIALETPQEQLGIMAGLPLEIQKLMLRETLDTIDSLGERMEAAMVAWKTGDTKGLEAALFDSMMKPEYESLYQEVIVKRNQRMAEAIRGFLADSSTYLVVVGSGHLIGEQSIIALLQDDYAIAQQ
jgi:uncharacterized protein YbaP (TraB family)